MKQIPQRKQSLHYQTDTISRQKFQNFNKQKTLK